LRKHPIAAFLPLQALLCFWNLGLLSPWIDQAETLLVVRLPLGLDWAVQARALSVSGVWCYFHKTGFRNQEYTAPIQEIAAHIRQSSTAVDPANSDPTAMEYALGPSRPFLHTGDPAAAPAVSRLLEEPKVRTIWFLRSTHDISPAKLDARFERQLRAAMPVTVHPYEAFTPLEIRLMRAMGMRDPPAWSHELLEFRR
jgi:hypothetical protein